MTLRPDLVRERLLRLRQTLLDLEPARLVPRDEFVALRRHHWFAERGLLIAAEIVFDIGNHVLAGHLNVHATSFADVVRRLLEQKVISLELHGRLRGLAGFRNILVHGYSIVDEGKVFDHLQGDLPSLAAFADEIERYLDGLPA